MKLPRAIARLALPWVASRTAASRAWELGFEGREALRRLEGQGDLDEWEASNAARALAKVRGMPLFDAWIAVRAGRTAELLAGRSVGSVRRADWLRAAWRGERVVEAALRAARRNVP